MKHRSILLTILLLLLMLPALSSEAVTLSWEIPDQSTEEIHLYQSTTAPVSKVEARVIGVGANHTIVTSPYSIYMDDNYVDAGVVYAATGAPLLRETTPGLGVDGTVPANVATITFYYHISGVQYTKAAVSSGTVPGDDVIPLGKYGAVALDIAADGVIDVIEAADNATGYDSAALAIVGLPAVASGHVRMGTVTATKSDGAFTFGTTALNAANVSAAFNMTPITLDVGEYDLFWFDNAHVYWFNVADAGEEVRISYNYTPIVMSHERYAVPASLKVAVAHKPVGFSYRAMIRLAGQRDRLTTAGLGNDGIATFDAAQAGASVDISYPYARPAVTKTETATIAASAEFPFNGGIFVAEQNPVVTAERLYAGITPNSYSWCKLNDPAAQFTSGVGVQVGDTVTDLTNSNTATVTKVDSPTILTVSPCIFNSGTYGHKYRVHPPTGVTTMTKVPRSPAAGQYAVNETGNYQFNVADAGKNVALDYTVAYEGNFTRKAVISGRKTSYTLRNKNAGTYHLTAYAVKGGVYKSKPSNVVTYTQAADDPTIQRIKIGKGQMQRTTSQAVTVGY